MLTQQEQFDKIQTLEQIKINTRSTVEKDGENKARHLYRTICAQRGGKFKISERQFIEDVAGIWIAAEFSASERILRCIELDEELNSRDMIRGEIHNFIMDLFKILKKRGMVRGELNLMDILEGKYSTRVGVEERTKNGQI